jgi:spermidine synthase
MIVGDGRNHVLLSSKKYDVIISQPTNPWISGVGDLFTLTYFGAAREMLKPGGIMCAWMQIYHMGDEELRTTMKTFKTVFPDATLWFSNESDIIMIGALGPLRFDNLVERMEIPRIREDLERILIDEPEDILASLLMDETRLEAYVGGVERFHTDDNMLLEFSAGRRVFEATHILHLRNFKQEIRPHTFPLISLELNDSVRQRVQARKMTMEATVKSLEGDAAGALSLYDRAFAAAPGDEYVLSKYAEVHTDLGDALMLRGEPDAAIAEYERALADSVSDDAWIRYDGLGLAYYSKGMYDKARGYFERVFETNPYNGQVYFVLGEMAYERGDVLGAIGHYERAVELSPWRAEAANNLAWLYAERGENLERALELARGATMAEESPTCYDTLGWVHYKRGELDRAVRAFETALRIDPTWVESTYHLALVHLGKGDVGTARMLLDDVIRTDKTGRFKGLAEEKLDEL